jgi:hypothetical protein
LYRNEDQHPVLIQRLADAVMNWPLATATTSLMLAAASVVLLGWAVCDSVARIAG